MRGPEDTAPVEERFADGNLTAVVRIGDTVRRAAGPWTPAAHGLLRHLEAAGFGAAPRVLGFDAQGREVLTFLEGETGEPSLAGRDGDEVLIAVACLIRRYHDATIGFRPPPDASWQQLPGAPEGGDVICHNDLAPYNTVFIGQQPVAFIDWDFVAPGPRLWDIAHAAWRFVPLYPDDEPFSLPDQARRLRLFCDAYGLGDRRGLLDMIARRQQVLHDTVMIRADAGESAFVALRDAGHGDGPLRDKAYLTRHRAFFAQSLMD